MIQEWSIGYTSMIHPLSHPLSQWIGLRETLQETIDFPIKDGAFL